MKSIGNKIQIDATGKSVGRLATQIADCLREKNKASFSPHIEGQTQVTVINCSQVKFTGKKLVQKDYKRHSMHPGGLKVTPMKKVFNLNPCQVLEQAVNGMLPKNKHRVNSLKRLILKP